MRKKYKALLLCYCMTHNSLKPDLDDLRKTKDELAKKWSDRIESIRDNAWKREVATLLENQFLYNEAESVPDWFADASINLIPYIYGNIPIRKMISVQPMLSPEDVVFYLRFVYTEQDEKNIRLEVCHEPVECKTRKLEATLKEGVDLAEVGLAIANQITREVVTDLKNNAGTYAKFSWEEISEDKTLKERYEQLYVNMVQVSSVVHRKTLRGGANWIYTSPKISDIFLSACTRCFCPPPVYDEDGIYYEGTVNNRWKHFRDTLFPENEMLIGYRGDSFLDSGYQFCPYVPLGYKENDIRILRGKKMIREGAKFFARLVIDNFDF